MCRRWNRAAGVDGVDAPRVRSEGQAVCLAELADYDPSAVVGDAGKVTDQEITLRESVYIKKRLIEILRSDGEER